MCYVGKIRAGLISEQRPQSTFFFAEGFARALRLEPHTCKYSRKVHSDGFSAWNVQNIVSFEDALLFQEERGRKNSNTSLLSGRNSSLPFESGFHSPNSVPAASSVLLPLICTIQLSINLRKRTEERRQLKRKGGMVCSYGICMIFFEQLIDPTSLALLNRDLKLPQTPGVGESDIDVHTQKLSSSVNEGTGKTVQTVHIQVHVESMPFRGRGCGRVIDLAQSTYRKLKENLTYRHPSGSEREVYYMVKNSELREISQAHWSSTQSSVS
ncbi:hypothetical protein BDZ97DRAFT_1763636 [Flammula alnicola]|nr:hypothetical protein BDZ97DRAFT_1763636 [Flammula alnicola]